MPNAPENIYGFSPEDIHGKPKPLADYKGQVLLIVNVASLCGFTPQYDGLEKLHELYKDRGLRVLGFPANDFGSQEPGSNQEISDFCRTKFGVKFDLFSKIVVKGPGKHPLFQFLTTRPGSSGEVSWNFAKFLVDRQGKLAARFDSDVDPLAKKLKTAVEELLAAR